MPFRFLLKKLKQGFDILNHANWIGRTDAAWLRWWDRHMTLKLPRDPNQPDIVLLEERIMYSASSFGLIGMGAGIEEISFPTDLPDMAALYDASSLNEAAPSEDNADELSDSIAHSSSSLSSEAQDSIDADSATDRQETSALMGRFARNVTLDSDLIELGQPVLHRVTALGLTEFAYVIPRDQNIATCGLDQISYRHEVEFLQIGLDRLDSLIRELGDQALATEPLRDISQQFDHLLHLIDAASTSQFTVDATWSDDAADTGIRSFNDGDSRDGDSRDEIFDDVDLEGMDLVSRIEMRLEALSDTIDTLREHDSWESDEPLELGTFLSESDRTRSAIARVDAALTRHASASKYRNMGLLFAPEMGIVTYGDDWQIDHRGDEVNGRVTTLTFRDLCVAIEQMKNAIGQTIYSQTYLVERWLAREEAIGMVEGYMGVMAQFSFKNTVGADPSDVISTTVILTPSQMMSEVVVLGAEATSTSTSTSAASLGSSLGLSLSSSLSTSTSTGLWSEYEQD